MKYKAVVFDLFGTLVGNFSRQRYENVYTRMAAAVDIPVALFRQAFGQTYHDRSTGRYASIEENIAEVCTQLGFQPAETAIEIAAGLRYAFTRDTLTVSPDVLNALAAVRRQGYRVGLLSNCGPDVPHLWQECALSAYVDAAVFSCQEREKKPALTLYRTTCKRLDSPPSACIFVGDGSDEELTGAQQAGLLPILKRTALHDVYDDQRPDVAGWQSHVVDTIGDMPYLLEMLEVSGASESD